jgi:RNA polymerase sigma-B factor
LAPVSSPEFRDQDARLLAAYAVERRPSQLKELVERYRPLSQSLANRYRGGREPFDDLAQVADLGLVKAIQGFQPEREIPFSAYAVPTILGELRRHFRDRVWNLRLPRPLQESTMVVDAATERLTERLGRSPRVSELAEETDLSIEVIDETLVARDVRWTASMEAPVRSEGESADALADLVGRLRFGAGLTQAEVGTRMGVSQMQVSRLSRSGLRKLLAAVQGRDT